MYILLPSVYGLGQGIRSHDHVLRGVRGCSVDLEYVVGNIRSVFHT